jgi:hypothetical protein
VEAGTSRGDAARESSVTTAYEETHRFEEGKQFVQRSLLLLRSAIVEISAFKICLLLDCSSKLCMNSREHFVACNNYLRAGGLLCGFALAESCKRFLQSGRTK